MSLERLSFDITTKVTTRNIHLKSIPIAVSARDFVSRARDFVCANL